MGVCIKLATRSLRKNKGRTLITLMGIVLSVLMVCTIFTLLNSMLDSAIDSIIEKDGYWHIAVYNTTAEQIADLEAAEGVLSTQMISIDENDVFRITLKNPDEVYEFASRYLSETTEYSYHTELLSYLGISQSESIKSLIMGIAAALLLIIAVAVKPEVLLMDEPTSALDPGSTMKVEELMSELKKNYTVVIVTHNMQQAARISDRTAFFLLGELVECGPTSEIFSTPKDKRTEDYISGRFG